MMNFRHLALPLAIGVVIGSPMAANAQDNGAKAISYISLDNISTVNDDPDSVPIGLVQDVETTADAILEGFPYIGDGQPETNWNALRECISQPDPNLDPVSNATPCDVIVDNEDFFEIIGYPNNKLSHADVQTFSTPDGGNPGNLDPELPPEDPRGAGATNIAQIQLAGKDDCTSGFACNASSNSQNRGVLAILAGTAPTSITVNLLYDYCRQGKLEELAGVGSFAAPTSFFDVTFSEVIPDPNSPGGTCTIDRFKASTASTLMEPADLVAQLNGQFSTTGPGPANTVQQPQPAVDPAECFTVPGTPRPLPNLAGVIHTNPNFPLAPPAGCDDLIDPGTPLDPCDDIDANLACFVAQPQVVVAGDPIFDFPQYVQSIDDSKIVTAELTAEGGIGVYKWYFAKQALVPGGEPRLPNPIAEDVQINDQFVDRVMDVRLLVGLMNPAGKNTEVDPNRDDHLTCYQIQNVPGQPIFFPPTVQIETDNFGLDTVRPTGALELCGPAIKNDEGSLAGTFYKCYSASSTQTAFPDITLDDQFFPNKPHQLARLSRLCTPVGINEPAPPSDPDAFDHLACYDFPASPDTRLDPPITVLVQDQWIQAAVGRPATDTVEFERRFCEPARKTLLP